MMSYFELITIASLLLCASVCVKAETSSDFNDYCVIGAGPSGLQMAYFLQQASREYVVYEKGSEAGTFFKKYPIHRKLISINKPYTFLTNKKFNFRHDWNSLLSHDDALKMTKYSEDFFPHADVFVRYLNDFAKKFDLNIQYNKTISGIIRREDNLLQMNDQSGIAYTCRYVIMATGIEKPVTPIQQGIEYTEGYEDLSLNLTEYKGQSVLIMGSGNSAFEVAQHIVPVTTSIHVLKRSDIKLAWNTHYVGHVRAVNTQHFDTYLLKSLDGLLTGSAKDFPIIKSKLDGRFYISEKDNDRSPGGTMLYKNVYQHLTRRGYDRIIRCFGIQFDDSPFHKNLTIRRFQNGTKYPKINGLFESVDVKNVYFTGANTHSQDFKKSAGAFIHGFRYTTEVLHKMLEWNHHGVKWPHIHFKNILNLAPHILRRMNEASDLYQMFGVLCDVVIFNQEKTEATYLEAYPCYLVSLITAIAGHDVPGSIMLIDLEYGKNFPPMFVGDEFIVRPIARWAHVSKFLHPVLYYYKTLPTTESVVERPQNWVLPIPDRLHHIVEDFTTVFNAPLIHFLPLRRFIENVVESDLRYFFAHQCQMLALTVIKQPIGCRNFQSDSSSHLVGTNKDLNKTLLNLQSHMLPFRKIQI